MQSISEAAIFRGLDANHVRALTDGLRPTKVAGGHVFFEQGDQGDGLFVIFEGKVKVSQSWPDGREHLVDLRGPTESFGEMSAFDPGPRIATATAMDDAAVMAIEGGRLRTWLVGRPEAAQRLLRLLARRLRRTDQFISELTLTDVPGRLANELLRLAQRFGVQDEGMTRVAQGLTQEDLAQLIGSSRETVNKTLSDFTRRGWIRLEGKSVVIAESDLLARRAQLLP